MTLVQEMLLRGSVDEKKRNSALETDSSQHRKDAQAADPKPKVVSQYRSSLQAYRMIHSFLIQTNVQGTMDNIRLKLLKCRQIIKSIQKRLRNKQSSNDYRLAMLILKWERVAMTLMSKNRTQNNSRIKELIR